MIDRTSLLILAKGDTTLRAVEESLGEELTLGVPILDANITVAEWIAKGAPGAPSSFADPADQLIAGLTATLANGKELVIRPCPRRSVGPDLVALFFGAQERFGKIQEAWLRIHERSARVVSLPLPPNLDPPVTAEEEKLLGLISAAFEA